MLQKPPPPPTPRARRYLHGEAVTGSRTNLSETMFLSHPKEYDRLNKKSRRLNLSSDRLLCLGEGSCVISPPPTTSVSIGVSANGSRIVLANSISSKLGLILAAINGVNGDS